MGGCERGWEREWKRKRGGSSFDRGTRLRSSTYAEDNNNTTKKKKKKKERKQKENESSISSFPLIQ
jgi:hypothetical protein